MPKNKISEYSSNPANNTDIGSIDIAEGCAPSGINNAIRELMAQLKDQQAGTDADNFTVGGNLIVNGTATGTTPTAGDSSTKFATTAFATTALQALHPVGSIYTSTVATNPNTLFGFGTWVAFGAGRVMVGVGGSFSAGSTGGSADAVVVSHTHNYSGTTDGQSATHQHDSSWGENASTPSPFGISGRTGRGSSATDNDNQGWLTGANITDHVHAFSGTTAGANGGVSGAGANLQPYIVVYMWNRTA